VSQAQAGVDLGRLKMPRKNEGRNSLDRRKTTIGQRGGRMKFQTTSVKTFGEFAMSGGRDKREDVGVDLNQATN